MNPILRQRLVGTLVLVALGVVFWPLIFVTPDQRDPISVQPMTDKPDIDRSPIAVPETYEVAVTEKLPESAKIAEEEQVAADAETRIDAENIAPEKSAETMVMASTTSPTTTARRRLASTRGSSASSYARRWRLPDARATQRSSRSRGPPTFPHCKQVASRRGVVKPTQK